MQTVVPGTTAQLVRLVTPDMAASFDDEEEVHPIYNTSALARHVEQVGRRLLLPHLDPGEEAVSRRLETESLAPVPVGATVELEAVAATVVARTVTVDVVVRWDERVVSRARFVQMVVDKAAFQRRVDRAGESLRASRGPAPRLAP